MRPVIHALAAFVIMIGVGWYSGLDMLSRGNQQAVIALVALYVAVTVGILSAMFKSRTAGATGESK